MVERNSGSGTVLDRYDDSGFDRSGNAETSLRVDSLIINGKKILVLGLGATGVSLLSFLSDKGATVSGFDAVLSEEKTVTIKEKWPQISLYSGVFEDISLDEYDILALSPGISSTSEAIVQFKKQGKPVVGDVELFAQQINQTNSKVIAITGSNGKSTVTTLAGFLCEKAQ